MIIIIICIFKRLFDFLPGHLRNVSATCPITGRRGAELNYQADDNAIGWAIHPFDGAVGNEALFEKRSATGHR